MGDFDASIIWEGANGVDDRATATAALCRYLWGPAPCRHPAIFVGPHGCTACGDRTVKA